MSFNWRTSKRGEGKVPSGLLLGGHLSEGKSREIAVVWAEPEEQFARCVVHYEEGSSADIPVVGGHSIAKP